MPDLPLGQPPMPSVIAVSGHGPGVCRYVLPKLWQVHLYPYACEAEIGGHRLTIRPGSAGITPPGALMRYLLPANQAHTYAHFIAGGATVSVPLLVDCGRDFTFIEARLRAAAAWLPRQPQRATVRLWDVLWEIASHAPLAAGDAVVERARDFIELRLATRLRVSFIARQLGISHSQLNRRFRAVLGTTVIGHIRARRARLAHLLLRSSDLDAAAIASQVGAGDLQALNKLLRRELGAGPRALRVGG